MTWIDFKALRQSLDFGTVLQHYGVRVKVRGDQVSGCCPLPTHPRRHSGKRTPSFSADLGRGIWQCFGCGAKGNVLDFAVRMEGRDPADPQQFRQAALVIQAAFFSQNGRIAPESMVNNSHGSFSAAPADNRPRRVNAPLGFELRDIDPKHPYLAARGLTPATIEHFGLGYCAHGLMRGRIAIPLHDQDGQLVGYAGRLVDDAVVNTGNPKYRFPSRRVRDCVLYEFRKSLFVYHGHAIREPVNDLVVVEGFPSVWWLWQNGQKNVVALMGATCSIEQAALIVGLVTPTGRVWAFPDGDEAGERCAASVLTQVAVHHFARWVKLTGRRQPTDYSPEELAAILGSTA